MKVQENSDSHKLHPVTPYPTPHRHSAHLQRPTRCCTHRHGCIPLQRTPAAVPHCCIFTLLYLHHPTTSPSAPYRAASPGCCTPLLYPTAVPATTAASRYSTPRCCTLLLYLTAVSSRCCISTASPSHHQPLTAPAPPAAVSHCCTFHHRSIPLQRLACCCRVFSFQI